MFTSYALVVVVFVCLFGGALGGMFLRTILPEHHLSKQTEDSVKLAIGVIATMCALVIGLLLASAKSAYETKDAELKQFSANLILLDRQLAHYGHEADHVHAVLRRYTAQKISATWPGETPPTGEDTDAWRLLEDVESALRALTPADGPQRWLQTRALQLSGDLAGTRWLMAEQQAGSIHKPFLTTVVLWLTIIFTSFGVFAPRNAIMIIALFVCSLSIASAMLLIVEMDHPFGGLMQISSAPMHDALAHLTR